MLDSRFPRSMGFCPPSKGEVALSILIDALVKVLGFNLSRDQGLHLNIEKGKFNLSTL